MSHKREPDLFVHDLGGGIGEARCKICKNWEFVNEEFVCVRCFLGPDMLQDVSDFHEKFGQGYSGKPRMLPDDLFDFRNKFHFEEIKEYEEEHSILQDERDLMGEDADPEVVVGALERQLDALVDSCYVLLGTAYLQFGKERFYEAWRRVVIANMAKVRKDAGMEGCVDSGREAKHDIVKPPGWTAPDLKDLVRDHVPIGSCGDEGCPHFGTLHGHPNEG